jgi:hypothetical protein
MAVLLMSELKGKPGELTVWWLAGQLVYAAFFFGRFQLTANSSRSLFGKIEQ